MWLNVNGDSYYFPIKKNVLILDFIKWEDTKPIKIDNLLKGDIKMNNFKVGDKVLFENQVVEITQIFDSGKCMVSNGWLQNSVWMDDLEPYKTAHDKLLELGWKRVIFDYIYYEKFNEKSRRTMAIRIPKDNEGYYVDVINMVIDLEMSKILTQYLEELENDKDE